jgi:hypothetical protein
MVPLIQIGGQFPPKPRHSKKSVYPEVPAFDWCADCGLFDPPKVLSITVYDYWQEQANGTSD